MKREGEASCRRLAVRMMGSNNIAMNATAPVGRPRGGSVTGIKNFSQYIYAMVLIFCSGYFP
jgi:hypothetical protein